MRLTLRFLLLLYSASRAALSCGRTRQPSFSGLGIAPRLRCRRISRRYRALWYPADAKQSVSYLSRSSRQTQRCFLMPSGMCISKRVCGRTQNGTRRAIACRLTWSSGQRRHFRTGRCMALCALEKEVDRSSDERMKRGSDQCCGTLAMFCAAIPAALVVR
jgi:hypothetical protein